MSGFKFVNKELLLIVGLGAAAWYMLSKDEEKKPIKEKQAKKVEKQTSQPTPTERPNDAGVTQAPDAPKLPEEVPMEEQIKEPEKVPAEGANVNPVEMKVIEKDKKKVVN